MKFKGKGFLEDIKKLKKLRNTDKQAYKKLMTALTKKYNTSEKTIYREMAKNKPGVRKTRTDAGKNKTKLTAKEKKVTKELLESGAKKTTVKKVLEATTGKKVSSRKLAKLEDAADKQPPLKETNFGKNIQHFLERYFELVYWESDKNKIIKLGSYNFELNKDDINDVVLVLTNAYNRHAELNGKKALKFDRLDLMKAKLYNMLDYRLRLAEAGCVVCSALDFV